MSARSSGATASARARASASGTPSPAARNSRQPMRAGRLAAQHHDPLERGQIVAREHADVVGVEEARDRAQQARAALAQHVGGLGALVARADRNQHRADALRADRRDHPLRDVGRPDRDAIAGRDPLGEERARRAAARRAELFEREPDVAVLDRRLRGHSARPRPRPCAAAVRSVAGSVMRVPRAGCDPKRIVISALDASASHWSSVHLRFDPADEAFRREVADWLAAELARRVRGARGRGGPGDETACIDERLAWERRLGEAGWIGLGWPVAVGGRGASLARQVIFHEEYARARAPGPDRPHRREPARPDADRVRQRGAEAALPAGDPRAARSSGARVIPSRTRAPISRTCRRARGSRATSG